MPLSDETRRRMRDTHADTNDSSTRYRVICRHVASGESLCPKDYAFYIYHCRTHGKVIGEVHVGKDAVPVGFTPGRILRGKERYEAIMSCRGRNEPLSHSDYAFLCRYCKDNGIEVPRMRAMYLWMDS